MNITITFGTNDKNFSVWSSGSIQNTLSLYRMLKPIKEFNVRLVNLGIDVKTIKKESGINLKKDFEFHTWEQVCDDTDLMIESSFKLTKKQTNYLRSKKTKLVLYKTGNAYVFDLEEVTFNKFKTPILYDQYDEIWTLPQHQKTSEYYLRELYNTDVHILPCIWNSEYIKRYEKYLMINNNKLQYTPHNNPKNITIFEPNINIVKSAIYPILIANKVYKERPELIEQVRVLNSKHLFTNKRFLSIIGKLKIFKDDKISFEQRYTTPIILSKVTDVVISHQWENELNYLYFDVLYGKYPLLHNSEPLKEYGFYYDGFNIDDASNKLIHILTKSDKTHNFYIKKCEQASFNYSIINKANINRYKERIYKLIG